VSNGLAERLDFMFEILVLRVLMKWPITLVLLFLQKQRL